MKAIEIIQAMVYDSALAECAQVHTYHGPDYATVNDWLSAVFGDFRIKEGELEMSDYLVLWSVDSNRFYPFGVDETPDVVLVRNNAEQYEEDDREVWLYKID